MDIEPAIKTEDQAPWIEGKTASSQRMKYEAEVRVFKTRHGDIENVRQKLGLSRRKMCQLMLVDPSAWSRWHAPGGRPPPHIYRMLEWFLALESKTELHPRLTDLYVKGANASLHSTPLPSDVEVNELCRQIRVLRRLVWIGPVLALLALATRFIV